MKTFLLAAGLALAAPALLRAQSVGIGTTTPNAKAALDISSSTKGLLIPRLDSASRAGISSPPDGLMVFQTDGRAGFWYAVGGQWLYIPDKTKTGDNLGNHTATQNLNLTNKTLVGGSAATPGTTGLRIDGNGLVRLNGPRTVDNYDNGVGMRLDNADAGFVVRTAIGYGAPTAPITGAGDRLMWSSYFAAFRAGGIDGAQWDSGNTGFYSAAFGYNNTVAGNYSLASGYNLNLRGSYCTALGSSSSIGQASISSFVTGNLCRLQGNYSLAAGINTVVRGRASVALGERCTANADNAVVLGRYASAAGRSGTFTVADASVNDSLRASANNQFSARYAGGYRLYTNAGMSIGVQIAAGGNSWTVVSDSTKKERVVLADGNQFLQRINRLRLGSWNYRGQDPAAMRHYGPMAQDFHAAFGQDAVGRIGNDSTINQADFDGVNLIAIQALYRRVLTLEAENAQLRQQQATRQEVQQATAALEQRLRHLEAQLAPQARH